MTYVSDVKRDVYEPDEIESASKMMGHVSTFAGLTDDIVQSTQHVRRSRNTEFIHLSHQFFQLRPFLTKHHQAATWYGTETVITTLQIWSDYTHTNWWFLTVRHLCESFIRTIFYTGPLHIVLCTTCCRLILSLCLYSLYIVCPFQPLRKIMCQ